MKNDDVIQTIPAYGSNQAFNKRTLPRGARRSDDFLDAQAFDPPMYGFAVDAISVPQQISWCGIEWNGSRSVGLFNYRWDVRSR